MQNIVTASVNTSVNANTVKTILDGVKDKAYDELVVPGQVNYLDGMVFMQESSDKLVEQFQLFAGLGEFSIVDEEGEAERDSFQSPDGTKRNFTMKKYMKDVFISAEFDKDDQHGLVARGMKSAVRAELASHNKLAFGVYNDAFAGAIYTTVADLGGQPLCSASHTTIDGNTTIDNLETASLDDAGAIDSMIQSLQEQVDYRGVHAGQMPECLLVPTAIRSLAERIVYSTLLAGSADNDLNPIRGLYNLTVKASPFLGTTIGGGSDSRYFVLGSDTTVMRFEREGTTTSVKAPEFSRNDVWEYRMKYREQVGIMSYDGVVGSNATA